MRYALIVLAALLAWSCRGKEGPQGPQGPQGPAGQDLVRPRQGFIQGVARGKDNGGNPFNISFSYSFYTASPGTWQATGQSTRDLDFTREDSLGVGYLSLSFRYDASNQQVSNLTIDGVAADISRYPVPTYTIQQLPPIPNFFPGTTQQISNLTISGDSVKGSFRYIRPSYNNIPGIGTNTHADTVDGTFSVKLLQTVSFGRAAGR